MALRSGGPVEVLRSRRTVPPIHVVAPPNGDDGNKKPMEKERTMMKKALPVAVAALVLNVGGVLAEPPMSVTEADRQGVNNDRPERLTDTELVAVTGRGCTEGVQALGTFAVVVGLMSLSHLIVASGQATIELAPTVCA